MNNKNNVSPTDQKICRGAQLDRVAFPLGGIGAGRISLEGTGAFPAGPGCDHAVARLARRRPLPAQPGRPGLDRLAGKIRLDMVHYWEDICYNAGPIIQPQAFHDIVVPRMKRVNNRLRKELGVKYISLDCDGNFLALLDGWLEAGVNILMPCEVDAGMDIIMLQERYGDRCGFHGGIQKKALIEGPAAIERELRRVQPAVRRGGYIPHLDHACPANVPLENYRHHIMMKREIFGCGGATPAAAIQAQA